MNWDYDDIEYFVELLDLYGDAQVAFTPDVDGGATLTATRMNGYGEPSDECVSVFLDRNRARVLMTQLEACIYPESVAAERVRSGALKKIIGEFNDGERE